MIEKIILDYLTTELSPVPVYMEVPANPTAPFVVVDKTGSSEKNHIKSATIALQSVADSLYEAASLNETVKEKMDAAVALDAICRSKLNSDYNFTDTKTKRYRYQAVYNLTHY